MEKNVYYQQFDKMLGSEPNENVVKFKSEHPLLQYASQLEEKLSQPFKRPEVEKRPSKLEVEVVSPVSRMSAEFSPFRR
jgi:hypothetical protein